MHISCAGFSHEQRDEILNKDDELNNLTKNGEYKSGYKLSKRKVCILIMH